MTLPRRVMVIAGAGSGKSTMARRIGACLDVPAYRMDREVFWLPGFLWFILSSAKPGRAKQQEFFNISALPKVRVTCSDDVNAFMETLK